MNVRATRVSLLLLWLQVRHAHNARWGTDRSIVDARGRFHRQLPGSGRERAWWRGGSWWWSEWALGNVSWPCSQWAAHQAQACVLAEFHKPPCSPLHRAPPLHGQRGRTTGACARTDVLHSGGGKDHTHHVCAALFLQRFSLTPPCGRTSWF